MVFFLSEYSVVPKWNCLDRHQVQVERVSCIYGGEVLEIIRAGRVREGMFEQMYLFPIKLLHRNTQTRNRKRYPSEVPRRVLGLFRCLYLSIHKYGDI